MNYAPAIGDSQTDITNASCRAARTWCPSLERALRALGADVQVAAYGTAGETTADMLVRLHALFRYCAGSWGSPLAVPPPLALIYAGVNDVSGIGSWNAAKTQKNTEAMIMALKHGAFGMWEGAAGGRGIAPTGPCYAATVSVLPADGKLGLRMVVLSDTETGTGAAANTALVTAGKQATSVAAPSVSGAVTVWEWRTGKPGKDGWGRVIRTSNATPSWCHRIIVISTNYLNWPNGNGDKQDGTAPVGTPYASYPQVRVGTLAAVTAQAVNVSGAPSVIYTDLFGYQKNLIATGVVPDFTGGATYDATLDWHYTQNNQHHGLYGHQTVVEAILNGGPAGTAFPTDWVTGLS